MNYDELVALLRGPNPGYAEASAAAQAIESLQARVAELEAERDEWLQKWRWERSHGCPDWGNHTSDGKDRVCWHRLPESWHDLRADKERLEDELAAARALLMNCRHILNAYDKAYGRGENFQRYDLPLLLSGIDAALAAPEEGTCHDCHR